MKRSVLKTMAAALLLGGSCTMPTTATAAPDLKDILGAGGGMLTNIVEGVFSKTDLKISDIAGEWTSQGSAVTFKSDNFLKKAGGIAAAGAVESQLDTYYKKYGLTGAILKIDNDGNFVLSIKKLNLKGTISVKSKGVFTFNFTAFGSFSLGTMDAYVEKTPGGLNVMFEADKIKKIISIAATLSGSTMATAADKLLQQYDGICIGFKMKQTGQASAVQTGAKGATGKTNTSKNTSGTQKSDSSATESALDLLKGLFGN